MAKYLVAVSGGVDSMVLLDMLSKSNHHLVIAHVDHGIRDGDSAADARFVQALAKKYQLPFITTELQLGATASEERARDGRYAFLFSEAQKLGAKVVTAHHADDAVETIALNFTRGTDGGGLAVLDREEIVRPLLALNKTQLYEYALRNNLEWVEDSTNRETIYLRNQLRATLGRQKLIWLPLLDLRAKQLQLRRDIDRESARLAQKHVGSRYFLNMLDEPIAMELLGTIMLQDTGKRPARPQLLRALHAVRTAGAGTVYQVGEGIVLQFTARKYQVTVV